MRLKNVKGAKEKINASNYIIKDSFAIKGNCKNLFNNNNPIHLEIGTGKGDFLISMAEKHPDINFIGIEKYDSVLIRAIEKVNLKSLDNIFFIREDAENIDKMFENEISKLYLNFSDPWPKERHAKRRLTSPIFLRKYESIFKNSIVIQMKTDNRHLFEYSLISMNSAGYIINEISLDLYDDDIKDNVPTEYETKFVNQGKIIYRALFMKN